MLSPPEAGFVEVMGHPSVDPAQACVLGLHLGLGLGLGDLVLGLELVGALPVVTREALPCGVWRRGVRATK